MTATTAAATATREPLVGSGAQRLEVGLLGARTAAVLRRVIQGSALDDVDRAVLRSAAEVMATTAEAVEGVATGGRLSRDRRSLGFGAMAFTVEQAAPRVAPAELPMYLRKLAEALTALETEPNVEIAERLLPAFSGLADVATQQAGTVGEGGGTLI